MQPRTLGFAALTFLVFITASDLVVAQITAPNCDLSWSWSFNSLGQNACTVGAYLMGTCNGGAFEIDPLPPGYHYPGPSGTDNSDLCKCNSVAYNLLSACGACQNRTWIDWSEFSFNCTKVLPPSTFPNPVPVDTSVPQWALVDTTSVNLWNATMAQIVGDLPEVLAGDTIGPSSTRTSTLTSSDSGIGGHNPTSTSVPTTSSSVISPIPPTPTPLSKKSSNTGAIAGGVIGGVVAFAIIVGLVFYILRQRSHSQVPSAGFVVDGGTPAPSMPHMSHMYSPQSNDGKTASMPGSPVTPNMLYNPNDPATFPGYHGLPTV